MNWDWYLQHLLLVLINASPWLLGGAAGLGALFFSPLGRSLVRYLRERERDVGLTEDVLAELTQLRQSLSEVIERLDGTDRELAKRRLPSSGKTPPPSVQDSERIPTPV